MFSNSVILSGLAMVLCASTFSVAADVPKIRFFCIHSSDRNYKETGISDKNLSKKLDLKLDFAFFVHGWQSQFDFDIKNSTTYKIGIEWVKAKKTNFCGVDWRELAHDGYYDASMKHVKYIGTQLSQFIMLLKDRQVKMESVSIAGHSLGAHVAGFAGNAIYQKYGTKISTIFGLDPAGPFFTSVLLIRSDFVLSKDNANFVQILHTTSGTIGTSKMIGHADYIANNGKVQEACVDELLEAEDELLVCSHSFAKEIFLSSFTYSCSGSIEKKPDGFVATIKDFFSKNTSNTTDVYGIHNRGLYGVFELKTSNSAPYCTKMI